MTRIHAITFEGQKIDAARGELLLDALLTRGVEIPYQCRAGHCGTCRVRVVSGEVHGGRSADPGIVHACQCRVAGDAVIERRQQQAVRAVEGVVMSLRQLSKDAVQVGIRTDRMMPHHAGQYAHVQFRGYPARPFSLTYPIRGDGAADQMWFHMRRTERGRVTPSLGKSIKPGHRVTVTGPYGSAYFRPNTNGRLILVATGTGFAPIWPIAVAALRENPQRTMLVVAGGRTLDSLYMRPALAQLERFPNVLTVPVCSGEHDLPTGVLAGRPTECMPRLLPADVIYACGAPGMVQAIQQIAAAAGVVCHADPFNENRRGSSPVTLPAGRKPPSLTLPAPQRQDAFEHVAQAARSLSLIRGVRRA